MYTVEDYTMTIRKRVSSLAHNLARRTPLRPPAKHDETCTSVYAAEHLAAPSESGHRPAMAAAAGSCVLHPRWLRIVLAAVRNRADLRIAVRLLCTITWVCVRGL